MTTQTYYAVIYNDSIYGVGTSKEAACEYACDWLDNTSDKDPDDELAKMHVEPITKALYDHVLDFGGGSVPTERIAGGLLDYDPYYYC